MLFSSMIFLWVFFPVVIVGIAFLTWLPGLTERRRIWCKNRFLLICSLFFYAWGGIGYVLIMLGVILVDFFGARLVDAQSGKNRKRILIITVLANLLVLFFFKYFNMMVALAETLVAACSGGLQNGFLADLFSLQGTGAFHLPKIVLPIGISFFTFQAISYVIDVYRGQEPQTNILDFALYISLFPQLIAGPIVQYSDIARELKNRAETREDFLYGVRRFCQGMGKKVLIANTLGNAADQIWGLGTDRISGGLAWLGIISYTLQIYYDFSGYS
ncbi:MAG: MBOAT family protein, partial [Lachnospiraceae bacterium]|nr:MBOAT family protein [Lachnospiraceae bacterium]